MLSTATLRRQRAIARATSWMDSEPPVVGRQSDDALRLDLFLRLRKRGVTVSAIKRSTSRVVVVSSAPCQADEDLLRPRFFLRRRGDGFRDVGGPLDRHRLGLRDEDGQSDQNDHSNWNDLVPTLKTPHAHFPFWLRPLSAGNARNINPEGFMINIIQS